MSSILFVAAGMFILGVLVGIAIREDRQRQDKVKGIIAAHRTWWGEQ